MLYTTLRLDLSLDTGSCSSYSMSVSKIREGSGGTEWAMGSPAVAAGSGFGSFAGSTGGTLWRSACGRGTPASPAIVSTG